MKTIRLIVAIYILLLSVYPCKDGVACADETNQGVSFSNNSNHHHTTAEQDFCSPFCNCSCCAAHVQLSYSSDFTDVYASHNTKINTLYFEKPLLSNARIIWQPPKIS